MSDQDKKKAVAGGLKVREAAVRALMAITLKKRPFDGRFS